MTNETVKANPYTDKPAPIHPAVARLARTSGARVPSKDAIRCSHPQCGTELDPGEDRNEEQKRAFAVAHGFVSYDGNLFCSKRCFHLEQQTPSGVAGVKSPADVPAMSVKARRAEGGITPGRVQITTLRDVDGSGATHWAECDYPACGMRIEVPPGPELEANAVRAAVAHGFLETPEGVYCGGSCARRHKSDVTNKLVREMPRVAAPITSSAKAHLAVYEKYAALVQKAATLKNVRVDLRLEATNSNLVALLGGGRVAAFKADTLEEACVYALNHFDAFCRGELGEKSSPFRAVTPMQVGSVVR